MLAISKRTIEGEIPPLNTNMYTYDKESDCYYLAYPFIDINNEIGISRNISKNLDTQGFRQKDLEEFLNSDAYNLVKLEYMFS